MPEQLDANILEQILCLQGIAASLPDKAMLDHVSRSLSGIPGVGNVEFQSETCNLFNEKSSIDRSFAVSTSSKCYGRLVFSIDDPSLFLPYLDAVNSFAFMLALIMEERALRARLADRSSQVSEDFVACEDTQNELQRMVFLLESIMSHTQDFIFVKDCELRIVLCSKPFAQVLGKNPEELIGYTDIESGWDVELVKGNPEKSIGGFEQDDKRALAGEVVHKTYDSTTVKGVLQVFDTIRLPLRSRDGEIVGILGISRDMTSLAQVYRDLHESEQHFRTIADGGITLIWTADTQLHCNYFNKPWLRFTGRTLQQELGDGWKKGVHPDDLDRCINETVAAFERKEPFSVEFRLLSADGSYRTIRSDGQPRYDAHGKFSGYIGHCLDVEDTRQAEERLKASELKYRSLFENAEVNIAILDLDGTFKMLNEKNASLLGGRAADFIGKSLCEVFPDLAELHLQRFAVIARDKKSATFEDSFPIQGQVRWFSSSLEPVFDQEGSVTSIQIMAIDITEQKQAESVLLESERRFLDLLSSVHLLTVMLDVQGNITFCNDYLLELTGWQREEVIGKAWFEHFVPESQRKITRELFMDSIHRGRLPEYFENQIITRKGVLKNVVWDNTMLRDEQGNIIGSASLGVDISDRKQAEELIWKQANFDALTELPNRRMFYDRLAQEIKKANRTEQKLALLVIDLDNFKEINDTLGHSLGDILLVEASRRIVSCVRETDTVARLGGDEFTVVLSELNELDSLERVVLGILDRLAEPFVLGEEAVHISASIGITLYPEDATEVDELLKGADQAMYAAKNLGRNCYSYFTASMQEAAQNRLRLINDMRGAVAAEQFRLHFQPIVSLSDGTIHKAEALVRWQHPQHGLVSPADFIPLAEETGLIVDIGNWVLKESTRWVQRWRSRYEDKFQVSVNKSPVQFYKDNVHDAWLTHMLSIGLPGQGLVIEITEGLLLDSDPAIIDSLLAYRDSGIQVAIDDFGTGYSSLAYLKKFDIDYLKIDQSFIRHLEAGSSDMALIEAIIVMAHKLDLKVIAEGVETAEQRDLIVAAGCDYAQGYFYSRPIPPDEFEKLLS